MKVNSLSRLSFQNTLLGCVFLFSIFFILSLWFGSVSLEVRDLLTGIFNTNIRTQSESILTLIRLPRVLLAAFVGALLSVSGVAMQGLFRNPLADPSLIGVTAGASAGGSVVIAFSGGLLMGSLGLWLVSLGAFLGGVISVWIVYRLANRSGAQFNSLNSAESTSVATMLLAGIAITAMASSLTSLLEYIVDNNLLRQISLWKMGGLDGASWSRVIVIFVVFIVCFFMFPKYATSLNAFLLGESQARYLGVDVERVKRHLICLSAAAVGVSVAMAGSISFVGLVVPHMMRLLVGPEHKKLMILSAFAGAILLVVADLVARLIIMPAELPVGLVTAIIGAPFFIYLLTRQSAFRFN
ncbi:MAG: FecCD family ABC transporter permease [Cellvibrionaceae bacterium]